MRRGALGGAVLAAALLLFVFSGVASADVTLGLTTPPAGSSPGACFTGSNDQPDVIVQSSDDPTTPYFVPTGGGAITSWSSYVGLDVPGTSLTFLALRPNTDGSYTVVGTNTESVPASIPASDVATYTLATPIRVLAGDTLGIYSSDTATTPVLCYYSQGTIPNGDELEALLAPTSPTAGQTLALEPEGGESGPNFTLNLAATLAQNADLSVTKTASVSSVDVGGQISYSIGVKNAGPSDASSTMVTDPLPSDVSFVSATSSQGTCSGTTTVTCNLGAVANGGTATITIVASAATVGTATNTATISSAIKDSNAANNTATATTTILALPLKLSASSHKARAGQKRCFAFTATSSGKGVAGVTVKFAHHTGHTSSSGKVKLCLKLKKGTYRASASKDNYLAAHATVVIKPAKPKKKKAPTFTG